MEPHHHMASVFKDMANAFALAIASVSNQKVPLRNGITLKVLADTRVGDLKRITSQVSLQRENVILFAM